LYITFASYNFCSDYISVFIWVSKPHLFCITTSHNQLKNLALVWHPIRSKSKTNRELLVDVFLRFASATRIYFKFRLVRRTFLVLCILWLARVNTLVFRHSVENFWPWM